MKKGSISIETIVIIILALLVLVIVAASFSGGMKALWDKIRGASEPTSEMTLSEATTKCNDICGANKLAFCTTSYFVKDVGPRFCKDIVTCEGAGC